MTAGHLTDFPDIFAQVVITVNGLGHQKDTSFVQTCGGKRKGDGGQVHGGGGLFPGGW